MTANTHRGEASLLVSGETLLLRPTFGALVAAEEELGSLFELVERAAAGTLHLQQMVALFDHLSRSRPVAITREKIGEAVVELGLTKVSADAQDRVQADPAGTVSFGKRAARLCGVAAALLGWRPEEFWNATPADLANAIGGFDEADLPLSADDIADLKRRFADEENQ